MTHPDNGTSREPTEQEIALGQTVLDLLFKWRREEVESGGRTYAKWIIREVREQVAREIEAAPGAVCSMHDEGESDSPHYPAEGWSYCDGCSAAEASNFGQQVFARIARGAL